ncbi:MAG: DUF1016 N-terminal domain-containing protein [Collinsella sp.]
MRSQSGTRCVQNWTHYRRLSRITDPDARTWYMNECADSRWSTRQLERQINPCSASAYLPARTRRPSPGNQKRPGSSPEISSATHMYWSF